MTSQFTMRKKDANRGGVGPKFTSLGISFDDMEANRKEQQEMIISMKNYISNLLETAEKEGRLATQTFCFVSSTWFCQTVHNDIYPAEIGLAQFSLQDGVFNTLHMYVDPGKLPLGESSTAQDHATATHKLPIPPNSKGIKSYVEILSQIVAFVDDDSEIPILYCHTDEITNTKKVIDKIVGEAGEIDLDIRIYPLEDLFYPLKEMTVKIANEQFGIIDKSFATVVVARDVIEMDRYNYSIGIGCKYHDEQDCPIHCALSKVKRWGFTIANHCAKNLQIELILGQHIPEKSLTKYSSTDYEPKIKQEKIENESTSSRSDKSITDYDMNSLKSSETGTYDSFNMHQFGPGRGIRGSLTLGQKDVLPNKSFGRGKRP